MNLKQILMSMGLSITTIIEFVILLLCFFIFNTWLFLLILLLLVGFISFKIWKLMQQLKSATRDNMFTQEIPKSMRAAYYSNSWSRIIDFSDYIVPSITKGDELLIKVHSAALNPADYKIIFTRIPFYS